MFTGIIEEIGVVKAIEKGRNYTLTLESPIFKGQRLGESIAVNGACLTISGLKNNLASFDIMKETIKETNLGGLKTADKVNLESALKLGGRLSGHFVTGHVDCVGKIIEKKETPEDYYLKVKIPDSKAMRFIVRKGSVALDGISLTIADIGINAFTVYLVPHTVRNTNLSLKKTGDRLNIEFDLIGKYCLRLKEEGGLTEEFLREHGFS